MIKKLKDFLYLGRLNRPIGALLLAYPCFWGVAMAKPDLKLLTCYTIIFFIGASGPAKTLVTRTPSVDELNSFKVSSSTNERQ